MTTIATPMSINSKIQEEFQETNQNDIGRVSVGSGRDTTSVISPKRQTQSTTVGDECVSYEKKFKLKFNFDHF